MTDTERQDAESAAGCGHTEHTIRAGERVGRWFPEPYDGVGRWEWCERFAAPGATDGINKSVLNDGKAGG
jgi:hypothetical protein